MFDWSIGGIGSCDTSITFESGGIAGVSCSVATSVT